MKLSQTFDDGYVFDPKDIVAEDENGYTVRHGDHYHYIWKSSLQHGQENTGKTIGKKGQITVLDNHSLPTPTTRNNYVPLKSITEKGHTSNQSNSKKVFPGIDYPTSDGFLFDGSGVQGQTALGLLIGHGTHTHLIPYSHLIGSSWESYIPTQYLEAARAEYHSLTSAQVDVETPLSPQEGGRSNSSVEEDEREAKKSYLAESLHVSKEEIKVIETDAGPAFVYPHGDHSHTILIEKVEVGKPIEDPHGDPHAHDKIGMATLKQLESN
ncbi:TPA: pneumococcal-type histidine triad protein [Streptococcus suis]